MRKSEIFENFTKIAQDKGLVSSEKSRKILEETSRADSLSPDDIKKLYQVKNNSPKGMDYKKNIMEIAHTNSVIAGQSYDKLNALVENNIERQNILLHIVNKRNDGLLVQRKYAEKELILSLIKIANDMDNKDKDKLRVLADTCLRQTQLKKKAAIPLGVGAGIIAALAGAFYLYEHLDNFDRGYQENYQYLTEEISGLINSHISWGTGYELSQDFINLMESFQQKLDKFDSLYQVVKPIILNIQQPRTAKEAQEFYKSSDPNRLYKAYNITHMLIKNMLPYLEQMQGTLGSEIFKREMITDRGFITKQIDKTQILHGGKGFVTDKFDDLRKGIPAYIESLRGFDQQLNKAKELEQERLRKIDLELSKPTDFTDSTDTARNGPKSGLDYLTDIYIKETKAELESDARSISELRSQPRTTSPSGSPSGSPSESDTKTRPAK